MHALLNPHATLSPPCRWGIAHAERLMVRADQLQLSALLSRKGNSGEVWRGTLWAKQVCCGSTGTIDPCIWQINATAAHAVWACMQRINLGAAARACTVCRRLQAASGCMQKERKRVCARQLSSSIKFKRPACQVAVKLVRIDDVDERGLDCLRREVAVLLHTTGECKQVRFSWLSSLHRSCPAAGSGALHTTTASASRCI